MMPGQEPQRTHNAGAGMSAHDRRIVDAYVQLHELIEASPRVPDCRAPEDVTLSERLAVRILVRHYGWHVTDPGTLVRGTRP